MDKTYSAIVLMTALALLAPIAAQAQDPSKEYVTTLRRPVVDGRVVGNVLQIEPRIGYEQAVLRVAGPRGYALRKRFAPGVPIEADLLVEAEGREAGGDARSSERASREEGPPGRILGNALPDGGYVYEVVLTDSAGGSRVHVGRFRVEHGAAMPRVPERLEPARSDGGSAPTSAPGARLSEKAFVEADFIKIDDTANDGTTFLTLDSDSSSGGTLEAWGLFNRFGNFTIEECGDGSSLGLCQEVLFTLLDDTVDTRRVGIGTAAPGLVDLHVVSFSGSIRLEDLSSSTWDIREEIGSLSFKLVTPNPLSSHTPGTKLVVRGSGAVGIGVDSPAARLHVGGSAIIDGDVAMGSSRTIKHSIQPVEPAAVLAAIRELPLYSWRYEADPAQALHLGPMAEDVHAAFELGRDDKHLSPSDSAGLALAAIQGLDAELERLSRRNQELARRLAALEGLLAVDLPSRARRCPEVAEGY